MRDAGLKNMRGRKEDWENELWSYLNVNHGINCPLNKSCQQKDKNKDCLSRDIAYAGAMHKFLDNDSLANLPPVKDFPKVPDCMEDSKILELVRKLAKKQADKIGLKEVPVPIDITNNVWFGQPVEVRLVPLKSIHGAIWKLKDGWVVHLNQKDSSARRRFTLFHEVFHILAHCNANPVFKKAPTQTEGDFNEMLADHFSEVMIMPEEMLHKKWAEVKDIRKMAAIFDIPEPVVYCGLIYFGLI